MSPPHFHQNRLKTPLLCFQDAPQKKIKYNAAGIPTYALYGDRVHVTPLRGRAYQEPKLAPATLVYKRLSLGCLFCQTQSATYLSKR